MVDLLRAFNHQNEVTVAYKAFYNRTDRIIEQWRPSPQTLKPIRYEWHFGVEYGRDVTQEATVVTTAISQSLPESV